MNYRYLGNTGVQLSEIGLGGWLTVGNALSIEQARAVLDGALELGINFLDTANVYSRGRAEAAWGELLAGRPRDEYVLATKVYFPIGQKPNQAGLSRKHIMEQCAVSLGRLRTDHIDLYQCHRYDEHTPLEETVRAMDDLIRQGKVLYWGFSEWNPQQVRACLELCSGGGYYAPKSSQPQYNLIQRDWDKELFPLCHKAGIGQVCFSPLAEGVLTGKYLPDQALPSGSRASDEKQNFFIRKLTDDKALLARVQRLAPIARELGCTMAQLALAWCLRRPEVTSVIVGASRPEQLHENAGASGPEARAARAPEDRRRPGSLRLSEQTRPCDVGLAGDRECRHRVSSFQLIRRRPKARSGVPVYSSPDLARDLARAERIAQLLDARFRVAGIAFGWDSLIGLVPVVGDIATAAIALYPIHLAHRHGLGRLLILRMLANVAVDLVVGAVPVLGDIFDVAWKANYRNLFLFLKAAESRNRGQAAKSVRGGT